MSYFFYYITIRLFSNYLILSMCTYLNVERYLNKNIFIFTEGSYTLFKSVNKNI